MDIRKICILSGQQAVADRNVNLPYHCDRMLCKYIIHISDRSCGRILDGKHCIVRVAVIHSGKRRVKAGYGDLLEFLSEETHGGFISVSAGNAAVSGFLSFQIKRLYLCQARQRRLVRMQFTDKLAPSAEQLRHLLLCLFQLSL